LYPHDKRQLYPHGVSLGTLGGMTVVAACGSSALPSDDVTDTHTPHRNVRVPDARWQPFGDHVGGRNRSAWLNDFMDWVNLEPQLWHDARRIAAGRGEAVGDVILTALRRYVSRHRDVLDDNSSDE
jgi:hypothetical protein